MKISATERARLSQTMGEYLWLMEKYSDRVRYLQNVSDVYASATQEWNTIGLVKPSRAEARKRDEYFKVCDSLCKGDPSTPLQCLLAVFAAWAALQLITDHDMFRLSDDDQGAIGKAANEYVMERAQSKQVDRELLPPHIQNALYLDENHEAGPKLELGQVIRYRNGQGKIRECTVTDCGTSKLRGEWYMIIHADDNEEEMVMKKDMEDDILSKQVPL